jgi:hypothetical protein
MSVSIGAEKRFVDKNTANKNTTGITKIMFRFPISTLLL